MKTLEIIDRRIKKLEGLDLRELTDSQIRKHEKEHELLSKSKTAIIYGLTEVSAKEQLRLVENKKSKVNDYIEEIKNRPTFSQYSDKFKAEIILLKKEFEWSKMTKQIKFLKFILEL